MTRNKLTAAYLDEIDRRELPAEELVTAAQEGVDLRGTSYDGRCLTRPVFLDHREQARLATDLDQLLTALTRLPERLFGGDLGAFARAAGMTDTQVTAILRSRGRAPSRLSRADLYHDGTGFRLMELNMGSTVGSLDNAMLNAVLVDHPVVAEFVAGHGLTYVDTLAEVADTLRTECEVPAGQRPLVAAADWPASFPILEAQLRASADALAPFGIDAVPCHLGQLRTADGRVWLDDRAVDVVYRIFMVEDLLDPTAPTLIDPILRAAERGEVKIFTPMDAELYGSKAALAMLSDEDNRALLEPAERASLDRLLPWTRMVRDAPVTVDGERVDLLQYAVDQRDQLVLKPTLLHGGSGTTLGWQTEPEQWRSQLAAAVGGPWVLQHRIHAAPEPFPADAGLAPWLLSWGAFTVSRGYGGAVVRGSTDLDGGVVTIGGGATAGCCFHQLGGG